MFTPRYVKHSKLLLKHAQKYLRYKKDVLSDAQRADVQGHIDSLGVALKGRDRDRIQTDAEKLDKKLHELTPVNWEAHWRENCEVILVAIIVAVGIRSYFLQPFKIPTGSMQPTLNGIIGHPMTEPGRTWCSRSPSSFCGVATTSTSSRSRTSACSRSCRRSSASSSP